MNLSRRDFMKTSAGAAAAGLVSTAAAKTPEEVVREVKFIDIHAHATEGSFPNIGGRQILSRPEQLLAHYDRLGVEKGVLLGLGNPENFIGGMSTESILRICKTYPGRFIPGCNIDPRACGNDPSVNFGDFIKRYRDLGCRLLGEVVANFPVSDPRLQNLFRGCEEAGIPLTFHMSSHRGFSYGIVDDPGMPQLELSLQRFPKLKIFGHSPAFWSEIGTYETVDERNGYPKGPVKEEGAIPRLMRKYPNLYGDLSAGSGCRALSRDPAYAAKFLTEFQDRIMFGLDICCPTGYVSPLPEFLRNLFLSGSISEAVFRKVARGNQIRLLGLPS